MSLFNTTKSNQILNPDVKHVEFLCILEIPELTWSTSFTSCECRLAISSIYIDIKFSIQYPTWALDRLFVHYQGLQDIEVCKMN